jgi:hypothetical protein
VRQTRVVFRLDTSAAQLACSYTPDLMQLQHSRSYQIGDASNDVYEADTEMRWNVIGRVNTWDGRWRGRRERILSERAIAGVSVLG